MAKFTLQIYFFTIIQIKAAKIILFSITLASFKSCPPSVQKTDHKPCTLGLWPHFPWNSDPSRKGGSICSKYIMTTTVQVYAPMMTQKTRQRRPITIYCKRNKMRSPDIGNSGLQCQGGRETAG